MVTPDQIVEAAKLIKSRDLLKAKLADIDGRLKKLGVTLPPDKAEKGQ